MKRAEFEAILREIFEIDSDVMFSDDTDLSVYIQDSIDLGELLSVIRARYGFELKDISKFSNVKDFKSVLNIINEDEGSL